MSAGRPLLATVAVLLLVVGAGCATIPGPTGTTASTTTPPSATTTTTTNMPDALDSRLAGLYSAENRTEYADTHGLEYDDGQVEVVVELASGADLPDGYDVTVTARHDELVQAWVDVDDLPGIASDEDVGFVRPPHTPDTDKSAGGSDA